VTSIRSAFLFQGAIQDAIYAFKYRGARSIGILLAQCMAEFWLQTPETVDVLIPVPLHPDRERQRGYNQAAILAEILGRMIERPVETRALVRVRPTRSQTKLSVAERRRNVADAFTCVMGEDIRGHDIMLVDDVATTGATLDACAVALLAGGARSVRAFTLARAV
jgi:ComF family protein